MKRINVEDIFTILCTLIVFLTSVVIVLTFLTNYHFISNMPLFNTYLPLQLSIFITMILYAIRFYIYRSGREKYIYSITCLIIAIISISFSFNLVM